MVIKNYDGTSAVRYAERWAFDRNPAYYNFDAIGGDCTNFVSQCIYAGSGIMNYTPINGWYYNSAYDRTASWTGVEFLQKFLLNNVGVGPFADETSANGIVVGDIIQLGRSNGDYFHTLLVSKIDGGRIFVSAHTFDAFNRPLDSYNFSIIKFLHIKGVRFWQ